MAGNPLVAQGTLNRLRGSIVIPNFPQLNVTAPYLGKAGITLSLEGNTTTYVDTMTGAVTSPEPYQRASVQVALLRTQNLGALYKAQWEALSTIGMITVRSDTISWPQFDFHNCSIMTVGELKYDGSDPGVLVTLGGLYYLNNSLWNQA